ncbi:DUF6339 family protein [Halobaculum sp. D14]|uniref:DUF6339 family protein n=1 Tax=Halobaculum sp. D14 TaxID=3421642 RepID=UPI003EB8B165
MSEQRLRRLTADGRRLIEEGFLKGEEDAIADDELAEYLELEPSGEQVQLSQLDEELESIVDSYAQFDTSIDAAAAPVVRESLNMSRRVAADPGVWHFLATVRYPDFVRHRWEFTSKKAMTEKFLGAGTDIYSNALHRLWWIAELTRDGDDYTLTEEVLSNQTLANKIFDRWFARYEPAAKVCSEKLLGEPSDVVDEATRRFNHALTNLQLEGLDDEDIERVMDRILEDVK